MGSVPSARFPYGRIIKDGGSVHLYHGSPCALLSAYLSIILAIYRFSPFISRAFGFLLFGTPLREHLPLFQLLYWSPFLKIRIYAQSKISRRRRKRKIGRNLGLGDFCWSCPLIPIGDQTPQAWPLLLVHILSFFRACIN